MLDVGDNFFYSSRHNSGICSSNHIVSGVMSIECAYISANYGLLVSAYGNKFLVHFVLACVIMHPPRPQHAII